MEMIIIIAFLQFAVFLFIFLEIKHSQSTILKKTRLLMSAITDLQTNVGVLAGKIDEAITILKTPKDGATEAEILAVNQTVLDKTGELNQAIIDSQTPTT